MRRRNRLSFDIYPAGQQQRIVALQPTRGSIVLPASTAYLERPAAQDAFNFQGDGVTSKFTILFWIKFNAFANTDTIMCKAAKAAGAQSHSTLDWALELGGTGKRFDFYAGTPSATPSVTVTPSGLTTSIWYPIAITFNGLGGASKYKMYFNSNTAQTDSGSSGLPQLLQNLSVPFAIGRPTSTSSDGHTPCNFEMQQVLFVADVLDATTIGNWMNAGYGVESSQYGSVLGAFSAERVAQYDFTEQTGATRMDSSGNGLHLTDNNTVTGRPRIVDFIENSPNYLGFRSGMVGPSNAPTRTRSQECWLALNKFGAGLHGITLDTGTLYCPTTILQGQKTGSYFFAGVWDVPATAECFEMMAGDDTLATGGLLGNNHSMFMGTIGSTESGTNLSAGQNAPVIRPDGTGMPSAFGGIIHNLAHSINGVPSGGTLAGNSYPASGVPVVIERSLLGPTNADYHISINGVPQVVFPDGLTGGPQWWDAFICNFINFTTLGGGPATCTLARACCFSGILTVAERLAVNRILKRSVGL